LVNGVRVGGGTPVAWMGDSRTLIVALVPGGRGAIPAESAVPKGPHVQESLGHAGPAPTFEDLLATPHDEDLFDYYATAQPAHIDAASGKITTLGQPGIYSLIRPSPDLKPSSPEPRAQALFLSASGELLSRGSRSVGPGGESRV